MHPHLFSAVDLIKCAHQSSHQKFVCARCEVLTTAEKIR
jgi:hypothetical protein